MHPQAYNFVAAHVPPDAGAVLEIGGQDMNGSVRSLFGPCLYVSLDLADGPGVDVVADASTWRPADGQLFDTVVCCEVLEHTHLWREIVQTAYDVLRPGGRLILTCAGPGRPPHSGLSAGPWIEGEWYRNITPEELTAQLRNVGFTVASVLVAGQDLQALARR